ncbi:hypothetical protein [Maribacter sp. IgM3_T14_3]|uniref:hypothetical protein n=1 Tax=Maribacter sp. IgM3_T14_3 TaxID=3415140 RepID=UPI003C6F8FCA
MPDEIVPLVDEVNNRLALVLLRGKEIKGYLFNDKRELTAELNTEEKDREYKQILGQTILDNQDFVVFLTTKNRRKFASSRFSFNENIVEFNEIDLDLNNEKILQTADYNNKFHVLTIVPKTAIINIYRFNDGKNYSKFSIDFSDHSFVNHKQKTENLYDMVTTNSGFYGMQKSLDVVKIETDNPTTLEIASNPTKIYKNKNYITLTFDSNHSITQIVEIDLNTLKGSVIDIKKAMDNWEYKYKNSNSFLDKGTLYQIISTRRAFHLKAQKIHTGEIINEYSAHENEKIRFKNSSIVQTGGTFDNHREFEDTGKLLRKLNKGHSGIAVQNQGDLKLISYGGVLDQGTSPSFIPIPMPGLGIPIAGLGAVTVFINPTFFAYQSYTYTKAIKVDALFNSKFEHQEGTITENVFDKIEAFEDENRISPAGRTVFKLKDSYILGNYDAYKKTYTLRSFNP